MVKGTLKILFLLLCSWNVVAQTVISPPIINYLTVDPVTGDITINWKPSTSPEVDGYVVYWHRSGSNAANFPVDTVWGINSTTFQFPPNAVAGMPDPRIQSVGFAMTAFDKDVIPYTSSRRDVVHYNIQVVNQYDSCKAELKLNWYPYVGWSDRTPPILEKYRIMRIPNGGGVPTEEKIVSAQDTSYTLMGIQENEQYTYYIEAVRSDGVTSTSYKTEKYTQMPIPPSYIIAEGTRYDSQGLANITFSLDPASQTFNYELLGSSQPDNSFVSVANFDNLSGSTVVLPDVRTREKTYYYKLEAWHVCKNKYVTESNTATALWIYVKQEDQTNTISWNDYAQWNVPAVYQVYRQIDGSGPPVEIAFLPSTGSTLSYSDNLSNTTITGDVLYWIIAVPESGGTAAMQAISNTVRLKPESDIWIPDAFTPNGDGRNDEYKPFFSYAPESYYFAVYDRNGARVFQTENIDEAWDGHLKNGKPANEGVYAYYIKYRTAKGRLVEKKGTFVLVIPN